MKSDRNLWSVKGHVTAGLLSVAILVGGIGGWAWVSQINGAVVASGQIEVDQNRQVVQHPDGGVVEKILVREGDYVEEGDLLIALEDEILRSELKVIEGQLFETIARRGRFEAEQNGSSEVLFDSLLKQASEAITGLRDGQASLFHARYESASNEKAQLSRRREQIDNQIDGIIAQRQALEIQLVLIGDELKSQQSLFERGLAQSGRVSELARVKAGLEGQVGTLIASIAEAEGRKTELDLAILKVDNDRREDAITALRDLQPKEIHLSEKRAALQRQIDKSEVKAPVSGVVYGLTVFAPKSVVKAADPILYLVPQDRPLVIMTKVQTQDIDQIRLNQEVAVKFPAFDQRRTPEIIGHITSISADAFSDQQTRVNFYRTEIAINEGQFDLLPEGMLLMPGMPVEAFIQTQARSPADYFIKPILDFFGKSFRET